MTWASTWGSLATGFSADGSWTFKRGGFIHPVITIREADSEKDLFVARVSWNGEATLEMPQVGTFRWEPSFWRRRWVLIDELGSVVMRIELKGIGSRKGEVTIERLSLKPPALSILALLGWHLIMNVEADNTAIVATTVIPPIAH